MPPSSQGPRDPILRDVTSESFVSGLQRIGFMQDDAGTVPPTNGVSPNVVSPEERTVPYDYVQLSSDTTGE